MPLSQFSRLISTGSALPSRCVTNDELARELASLGVETSDEWIRSRTGIETRYLVSGEEGTLSLAVGASRAALESGLEAILCVGETLEQREADITGETIAIQVKKALAGVTAEELRHIIIAYEPVWAIGTGKTATDEQANEVNHMIRALLGKLYGEEMAEATTIQYGGSMNAKNAAGLLAQPDIDGGLIGGASLKAPDFAAIVEAASK